MPETRFRRRKEARPAEITQAAMEAFAEHGYDATRVDDVAKRAGISKGLLYLYFRTKEELFKAVIRSFVQPRVAGLIQAIDASEGSAEDFLRGPFLDMAQSIPRSRIRHLVRLMVSEGPKHPDLTKYYWEHIAGPGVAALRRLFEGGVERGEFRASALDRFPQLLVAPVLFSTLWQVVFEPHEHLDTDALLAAHVEFVLDAIRQPEGQSR
jgi:AcrR family transcriptional regulator